MGQAFYAQLAASGIAVGLLVGLVAWAKIAKPAGPLDDAKARALLALPVAEQSAAAARVVEAGMSVRDTERLVHQLAHPKPSPRASARRDPDTARLENHLGEHLGAVVRIEPGRRGAGRVVIRYSTLEQLDGLVERLTTAPR